MTDSTQVIDETPVLVTGASGCVELHWPPRPIVETINIAVVAAVAAR